jgi:hypothetical protein
LVIGSTVAQFNPPPPKQPSRLDEDLEAEDQSIEVRQLDEEEPEFMFPKITEDGHYQVDDMVFLEGQYQYHYGDEEEQRQAIASATMRWTNKIMPYAFDYSVSSSNQNKVRVALRELNNALANCIKVQ